MKKDLLILLLLVFPAIANLFRPGFFQIHDNLQPMRQLEMAKCLADGQFPCRWVPDMGLGYGYPLFNYYPPFPYYLGQAVSFFGFSNIDIVKIVGILGFAVAAAAMYFLGKEFWGRGGGLVSAAFYTYAPYHSVDFYVRGAMNEFWAMAFYPAIFLFAYRLIKKPSLASSILLSLSLSGLMLSHNLMLMIFTPFFLAWLLFWLIKTKNFSSLKYLVPSGLLAFGLSAFFTLPVLFEQKYVHVETLTVGYFNYLQHFLDIDQLFKNIYWGYGSSGLYQRTMSFALGYLHWIIPALILVLLPFLKSLKPYRVLLAILILFLLSSLFMAHWKSNFIWARLPYLQYLQFPWRFLTLSVFFASLVSGAFSKVFKANYILVAAVILLNANYFHPVQWWQDMTDAKLFSGASWQVLQAASIFDYLPKTAKEPPVLPTKSGLEFVSGSGIYTRVAKKSNYQEYKINVSAHEASVQLQSFYFPGWKLFVDGQPAEPQLDPLYGRPQLSLSSGTHILAYKFFSTPIRQASDAISLVSWITVIILVIWNLKVFLYRHL